MMNVVVFGIMGGLGYCVWVCDANFSTLISCIQGFIFKLEGCSNDQTIERKIGNIKVFKDFNIYIKGSFEGQDNSHDMI